MHTKERLEAKLLDGYLTPRGINELIGKELGEIEQLANDLKDSSEETESLRANNAVLLEALKQIVSDTTEGRQATQASINKANEAIRKAKGD